MCTGLGLIAGVAHARLPYAENPVSGTGPACTRGDDCPFIVLTVRACRAEHLDDPRTRSRTTRLFPAGNPVYAACTENISGLLPVNTHASASSLYYTHTPQLRSTATSYHTQYAPADLTKPFKKLGFFLNADHDNSLLEGLAKPNLFSS